MPSISTKNNFTYLFIALIGLLFSTALLPHIQKEWMSGIIELIIMAVFLLGLHSLKAERSWMWAVYFMSFVTFSIFLLKKFFLGSLALDVLHLLILLSFFIGSFSLSIKQIVLGDEIDTNMIIGSLVLYILLGMIWSVIYLLVLMVFPDAFNGLEALSWQENFSHVTYYSFVTLTTLGYGDISPRNSVAEFFVLSEAVVGVFYMAIIVSSLVGARMNSMSKE